MGNINNINMKNLKEFNVTELTINDSKSINGGILWGPIVAAVAAVGAGMAWAFDKGEALGKAMA
jgi:hypothetical protein